MIRDLHDGADKRIHHTQSELTPQYRVSARPSECLAKTPCDAQRCAMNDAIDQFKAAIEPGKMHRFPGIDCRSCGIPIPLLSFEGDLCTKCFKWETAQRLILRANRLLEVGR